MNRARIAPATVLCCDPPWPFDDKLRQDKKIKRGTADVYKSMLTLQEIVDFPMPYPIADDALLFLWRVASMQEEALKVMRAWGFTLKSEIVWAKTTQPATDLICTAADPMYGAKKVKLAFGMGRYVRGSHETCLIGRRGKAKVENRSIRSVFFAPVGEHSAKPDEFYRIVRTLCPTGPRVNLFERTHREGFICFGDEL